MYYIMTISNNYPNNYWLEHINKDIDNKLHFNLNKKASKNNFLKYDYIVSDGPRLFSKKLYDIIKIHAPNDIQFLDADVYQDNILIGKYFSPIFLKELSCIDYTRSIQNEYKDFIQLAIENNSLKDHMIVYAMTDKGLREEIVVQYSIAEACRKAKIKGADFIKEPYRNPIYE